MLVNDNTESRDLIESCYKRLKVVVNPIIDWTDSEVWEYIRDEGIPYCSLYDEGFSRLGCIGCPMAKYKARKTQFNRWPKYKAAYIRAIQKMLAEREARGLLNLRDAEGTFNWWIEEPNLEGQLSIFDDN